MDNSRGGTSGGFAGVPLSREFADADAKAVRAHAAARRGLRVEITLLVGAAAVASVPVAARWPAVLAALAFAASLAVRLISLRRGVGARWRRERADAERIKSRDFQVFAFDATTSDRHVRYMALRLREQQRWYTRRAAEHERRAGRLGVLLSVLTAVAALVAAVQAFGVFPSDFVGVASSLVGAFEAWRQAEQDQQTAETYRQASDHLAALDRRHTERPSGTDGGAEEDGWVALVGEAERVMTSEHQQWLIRRSV